MKPIKKLNNANTLGIVQLSEHDAPYLTTIGCFGIDYLTEMLCCLHPEGTMLTVGYFTAKDVSGEPMNCLLITDGKHNVGLAPMVTDTAPTFIMQTEEQQHMLDMIKSADGPWSDASFRLTVKQLLEEDATHDT